jgi:hypothetical protein
VEDLWRSLDVGEPRADGVEKFFRVLASAGEIGPERGCDLAAARERGDAAQGNENGNGIFHSRKFNAPVRRGKGAPPKGRPKLVSGALYVNDYIFVTLA